MQTLIIILIVALIAQTCVFIYANFIDTANKRSAASMQEMVTAAQNAYLADKERLQMCIDNRDHEIHEWAKKYNELVNKFNALGAEYERVRKLVPDDEVKELPYIPNVDQIKSVYAAAGILSSLNEKTDSDHLMALWADLKAIHKRYNVGVDVGAGDDHSPEPPSFEESQGESGTNVAEK